MPFTEDHTVFFSVKEFASAATLDGVPVNGIHYRGYAEALGNDVEGFAPSFLCAASDIPSVAQGQTLIVDGTTYKVRGVEPDDSAQHQLLRLEQQ